MEIKVGEYFRNKYGIAKLIKIEERDGIQVLTFDRNIVFLINPENGEIKDDRLINKIALLDNIDLNKVKHAENIIDLIEVEDIITIEHKTTGRTSTHIIDNKLCLQMFKEYFEKYKDDHIASILTKEQFNQSKYVVGDE